MRASTPRSALSAALVALALLVAARAASADDRSSQARAAFLEGTAFVEKSMWPEAAAAFERASMISPHAITTYNLGACERATGHFTRAHARFQAALAQHRASGDKELPANLLAETKAFLSELDHILVRATVTLEPDGSTLAIDGRPLDSVDPEAVPPLFAAGRREAGPGDAPSARRFVVLLNPGAHVFVFGQKGFANGVVSQTFRPGERATLNLSLERLPATLNVSSNRPRAVVSVDGIDVGQAPVSLSRAPGEHRVVVRDPGFVPFVTRVSLAAGEDTRLDAPLAPEKPSVFSRWWFWTAAGVVVVGAAVTTYAVTRPEPRRAEVGGGTLGWSVAVP